MLVVIVHSAPVDSNSFLATVSDQDIPPKPWHGLSLWPVISDGQSPDILKEMQIDAGGSLRLIEAVRYIVKLP